MLFESLPRSNENPSNPGSKSFSSRHSITFFIRELDEIDIGSPRTPNEITPAHLGKVELSEWTTNEVSEQNGELLCRGSLHGIRCHPEQ
jgi:hypothetical protein